MSEEEIKVVGTTPPTTTKKTNWKVVGAIVGVVVLILGAVAGFLLVRQQQDIREQAERVNICPQVEACPDPSSGELVNCTPPEVGNNPTISLCNISGRVELCGGRQYCCPTAGGSWTTNLSLCPQAIATPSATAVATATAQPTATVEPTAESEHTATPTIEPTSTSVVQTQTPIALASQTATAIAAVQDSTSEPFPVPETGASLPTIIGISFGLIIVIGSIFLAL